MFSRLVEKLHRNTALNLTLRFLLLFVLCASALFFTVNYLLVHTHIEKDQQFINSLLNGYQRLEQQAGVKKLKHVIERDTSYIQKSDLWVELKDLHSKRQMLVKPNNWPETITNIEQFDNGTWQQVNLSKNNLKLLMREATLNSGEVLRVGLSVTSREAQISQYQMIILQVMLPLVLLGLLLTAWMNWKALRPVRDLIHTVQSIRGMDLKARVTVRNPSSELGELAQLFNEKLSQIEALINSMQQSLDAVAHDFRTPLARMRLSVESALSGPKESQSIDQEARNGQIKEALMDCAEESQRIEAMLNTLMDITEAESGILKLHPETLDLSQLIAESLELYRFIAEEKNIQLALSLDNNCIFKADKVRVHQVIGNLLDNAIKYTPVNGKVWISIKNEADYIFLQIRDNGIGISKADQPHVFERLYRADQSRSEPGMGLGLCLAKAVVEAHRGTVSLTSTLGEGSCFSVKLPV